MVELAGQKRPLRIGIVAGEPSGDLLAAHLMAALHRVLPAIEFIGIGGPKMEAQGLSALYSMQKLAVRGYWEVLTHFWELVGIRRDLKHFFLKNPPDLFIGVDAPDFNLGLESALKKSGIPTIHYISPSIWAWRPERIKKIKKAVDHLLALFPMEPPIYQKAGVPVTYVGHPLADVFPIETQQAQARECLKIEGDSPLFALLPGSRDSELNYLGRLFIETAKKVLETLPDARFLVPFITRSTREHFLAQLKEAGVDELLFPLRIVFGHSREAMAAADAVLIASGTATLEAALLKKPMVITYRLSGFSYFLMKRKQLLPWVGLPNILANENVVPEILQDEATPDRLAEALIEQYQNQAHHAYLVKRFTEIHHILRQNTAEKAAGAVVNLLKYRGIIQ